MKRKVLNGVLAGLLVVAAGCGSDKALVHSQGAQQLRLAVSPRCVDEYKTLITANEAFWATNMVYTQDQSDLVDAGFLYKVIDDFHLVLDGNDYDVVAVGDCTGFDPTVDQEVNCGADLKVLQTASEAYYANYGTMPASEQDLVDAGLIRNLVVGYDLDGTEPVAVPGICG